MSEGRSCLFFVFFFVVFCFASIVKVTVIGCIYQYFHCTEYKKVNFGFPFCSQKYSIEMFDCQTHTKKKKKRNVSLPVSMKATNQNGDSTFGGEYVGRLPLNSSPSRLAYLALTMLSRIASLPAKRFSVSSTLRSLLGFVAL